MRRDWQPELLCFEKLSMSGFFWSFKFLSVHAELLTCKLFSTACHL
jgi:hypothetical protein